MTTKEEAKEQRKMWQIVPSQRLLVPYLPSTPILNKPKPNSGFSRLPAELLIQIIFDLTSPDIVSIRAVNHKIWNLVTPAIFNSIIKRRYASKSELLYPELVGGWLVPKHPAIRRLEDEVTGRRYTRSREYRILCLRWKGYYRLMKSPDFPKLPENLYERWWVVERGFEHSDFPYPPPLGSSFPRTGETKKINIQYADLEREKLGKLLAGRRDEYNAPLKMKLSVPGPQFLRFLEEWPLDKIKYMLGDDENVPLASRTGNWRYDDTRPWRFNGAALYFLEPWLEHINGLPIESGLRGMGRTHFETFRIFYGLQWWEGLEPYRLWYVIEKIVLDATKLRDIE